MFVKICGVMDVETARFAVQKGANFIGLLFSKVSPRAISLEQAKEIVKVVRSLGAEPVAVFADESLEEMRFIIEALSLNIVQLHGQIPRKFCDEIAQQKIYVADGLSLPKTLDSKRDFLLFENHFEDPKNFRFFIAGNLNAENVRTNIERFKPHGVDASRGVREKKGIEAFIEQARRVPDHKNFQRGLSPDFSAQQSAEGESNLHQVVEPERKAGLKKMGQSPKNFCGRVLGRFGAFGGQYVPELLIEPLKQLEKAFNEIDFEEEFLECLREFAGRPTTITEVPRFAKAIDGPRIFLKREDLLHTGAHKINNAIGQCLLAKKMGKTRVIAETGAGQHGVATATACAFLGLECVIYMGKVDMERQEPNVVKMRLLGAEVIAVTTGAQTLKDAVSEALRDYAASYETTHYCLGSALGPHPYPTMVAKFQKIIGEEAKEQMQKRVGRDPDLCIACVGGGSNAIGLFSAYLNTKATLVGVEAAGAARFQKGSPGVLHGTYSYLLQDENGQVQETCSISAGLDYPSVGPKHAELFEAGRVQYDVCTDEEALSAFRLLSRTEGIIPALESAHALGYLARVGKDLPKDFVVLVNLSGRGDKDVAHIQSLS